MEVTDRSCVCSQQVGRQWPVQLAQHCGAQPIHCISLSVKNCLLPWWSHCWGHRKLLSHIIHSQLLSPPWYKPWFTPETAWKSGQFWVKKHSVLVCPWSTTIKLWPVVMSVLDLTPVCVFSATYCSGHSERRMLSDESSSRTWIFHNLQKLTSCRFKS